MYPGQTASISSDSGEDDHSATPEEEPTASREFRILRKMKSKLKRHPENWAGNAFDFRDNSLLYGLSADFLDYSRHTGTCHLAKIVHFKRGEDLTPEAQTYWNSENDNLCKAMVSRCGGKVHGFSRLKWTAYPEKLKELHTRVDVQIMLPTIAMIRYNVAWGILSTRSDKVQIYRGPKTFTPKHPWDAMVLHDCTANYEGELWKAPEIASRRWDILLMKMGSEYDYPWLPVTIRDAGPFQDPRFESSRCFPGPDPIISPSEKPSYWGS
ncbi:hypothetical protein F4805DRAFT_461637 [Annulohypoxylon moriforme]|nr:hypothetical protein F4805DRAFT_461637 [Annulohypoxylon moriforme]